MEASYVLMLYYQLTVVVISELDLFFFITNKVGMCSNYYSEREGFTLCTVVFLPFSPIFVITPCPSLHSPATNLRSG